MQRHEGYIVNFVKDTKKVALMFGGVGNLILSLSLSQALASTPLLKFAGDPRVNIRLFLHPCKGSRIVFYPLSATFNHFLINKDNNDNKD